MCLNCGCGEMSTNHGDPLNLTLSRLALIATRNGITLKQTAVNILATLMGEISKKDPRGDDKIEVRLTRTRVKPEMEAKYVERRRTKGTPKGS